MSSSSVALSEPDPVQPRHLSVPASATGTLGPVVAELVGRFGLVLEGHQRLSVDAMCSVGQQNPDRWVGLEAAIIEPRQNGKTVGVLLPIALYVALRRPNQEIIWSAHRYKTARAGFRELLKLYRASPLLHAKVKRVAFSNGEEEFEFTNGSRITFVARSQASGRGLSGDLVILDEALFLTAEMMGALLPTLSARVDPLVVYASSAGLVLSAVLRDVRDRGRAGDDPSLVWVEYCAADDACAAMDCEHAKDAVGCACDDPAAVRSANPSERVSIAYIAKERRAMAPEEFTRERMGWWDDPAKADDELTIEAWNALADPSAAPDGRLVFGVDVARGHASASIVVTDGRVVELIERRRGVPWLTDRLADLAARHEPAAIAYDPAGPIGSLVQEMEQAGLELTPIEGKDSVRACGALVRAVNEGSLEHRGEPEFAAAVAGAKRRNIGDGHKWSRKDSTVDITPLVAATVALWAAGGLTTEEITPGVWFV